MISDYLLACIAVENCYIPSLLIPCASPLSPLKLFISNQLQIYRMCDDIIALVTKGMCACVFSCFLEFLKASFSDFSIIFKCPESKMFENSWIRV